MLGVLGLARRLVAVANVGLGMVVLIGAGWFLLSLMTSHARWGDALILGPAYAVALLMAAWYCRIGWRTWRARPGWRAMLWRTHLATAIAGLCLVWTGIADVRAAARSAAHGGGLLGGLGEIVAGLGLALAVIAAGSLLVAWLEKPGGWAARNRRE
jgi:hypothetical protein